MQKPQLQAKEAKLRKSTLETAQRMTGELLPGIREQATAKAVLQLREAQLKVCRGDRFSLPFHAAAAVARACKLSANA